MDDGWELVENYREIWSNLGRLHRRAYQSLASLSADSRTNEDPHHIQHLNRMSPRWLGASSDCQNGTSSAHTDSEDDEDSSANSSQYTSAAESTSHLLQREFTPLLLDAAMLGEELEWKLIYSARHFLTTRWHQSNKPSEPKSRLDSSMNALKRTTLPSPLNALPEEYRNDQTLRMQWRDRYWSENYSVYLDNWVKDGAYIPGARYLSGHTDSVYCVQFDAKPFRLPDNVLECLEDEYMKASMYSPFESCGIGSRGKIITGSRDKSIKIWDGDSGLCLHTLTGHRRSVLCIQYDDEVLLSGSSDMTVIVWDLKAMYRGQTPSILHTLRGHRAGVLDIAMKDNWVVSCGKDWIVRVYDRAHDYALVRVFTQHTQAVNAGSLCVYEGSMKVVTASGEGTILLWDIATGEVLKRFEGHTKGLACVKFANDVIISGSNDWTVRVWDVKTTKCLAELRGHWDLVRAICYSPKRRLVLTGGYDGAVKMFNIGSQVHPDSVFPHSEDGHTTHYTENIQTALPPFEPHMVRIFDVQFDGTRVVSCGESNKICVRDFAEGCPLMRMFA